MARAPSSEQVHQQSRARHTFACVFCGAPSVKGEHFGYGLLRIVCDVCSREGMRRLSLPSAVPDWVEDAACAGDPPPEHMSDIRAWAQEHCVRCPVTAACAAYGYRAPVADKTPYAGMSTRALKSYPTVEDAVKAALDDLFTLAWVEAAVEEVSA
jgi:hypothetical protein